MTTLVPVNIQALAVRDPWSVLPPLGSLDAYIGAVNRLPMLTLEQERAFAEDLKNNNDLKAAGALIMSHLRLVVSVSRQYLGYGLPHGDLIQEGNIGLMKAVRRFDPEQGVRLVSYALHWIKAEIHEYVLKNWRMVKVATTKAQRKLFFNLRSMKQNLQQAAGESDTDTYRTTLNPDEVDLIAAHLRVKREEVLEMETRLAGGDVVLDPSPSNDGEEAFGPISYLTDARFEPTNVIENTERDHLAHEGVGRAIAQLDDRAKRIVTERWLKVNDDGGGGMTLHELADRKSVV